jgi:glycine oxidase
MLAPVTEATVAESALTRAGLASIARWPTFAADLEADTGMQVGLRQDGTLQVAFDPDDRRALDELLAVHRQLGLTSEWCSSRRCRELEPLLSPSVRGGLLVRGDWQVDPRAVVVALMEAVTGQGGTLDHRQVRALCLIHDRVTGVELDDGTVVTAGTVLLAAGARSAGLAGLPPGLTPPVRPVKGEILRLRADPGDPPFARTIRGSVEGRSVYLIARSTGEVVIGATVQEAGFDTTVRSGAVHDLLHAAIDLVPAVEELEFVEARSGLRPGTPDNGPILGSAPVPGLVYATGHHRNGVLLAPLTADAVVAVLGGHPLPVDAAAFSLGRFA